STPPIDSSLSAARPFTSGVLGSLARADEAEQPAERLNDLRRALARACFARVQLFLLLFELRHGRGRRGRFLLSPLVERGDALIELGEHRLAVLIRRLDLVVEVVDPLRA